MSFEESVLKFGKRLRNKQVEAWHIGLLLGVFNVLMMLAVLLLLFVTLNIASLGIYILLLIPFIFAVFWLWFTQRILQFYHTVSVHDTLLIAKVSIFPFLILFILGILGMASALYAPDNELMKVLSYYAIIFGAGSIMLGLTIVTFGLRHRIQVTTLKSK